VFFNRSLACSFCGKSAAQVPKLVAGAKGYICNLCAAEAHRIMSDPNLDRTPPVEPIQKRLSWSARIKRLLVSGQRYDPLSV
jgi:ATP-dependent Clp protease ATP-binding subunit ClpX